MSLSCTVSGIFNNR